MPWFEIEKEEGISLTGEEERVLQKTFEEAVVNGDILDDSFADVIRAAAEPLDVCSMLKVQMEAMLPAVGRRVARVETVAGT